MTVLHNIYIYKNDISMRFFSITFQCPRCLKTFSLFSEKGYNSSIAVAFVEHLQSHQDGKRIACKKCCLSFKVWKIAMYMQYVYSNLNITNLDILNLAI